MKTLLKVFVGLALSGLTIYLFLRNIDLEKVRAGLQGASLPLLLVAILLGYFGHLALRSWRWATMLEPLTAVGAGRSARLSFYNLFSTTAIGYAISGLTPGRIGEVIRPILLGRREGIASTFAIATVGLERVLDAATVLILAALSALSAPVWSAGGGQEPIMRAARWLGGAGLAGCALGFVVARALVREDSPLRAYLERRRAAAAGSLGRHGWSFACHLTERASFLRDARRSLRIAGQSLLVWGVIGVSIWVGLLAAGVRIPFAGVYLLQVFPVIGIAMPTPGGAGTVQLAYKNGLIQLFGVEENLASVATILYHPVTAYFPAVVFGLLFAWRDGLTLGKIRALAESPKAQAGASLAGDAAGSASARPADGAREAGTER